MKFKDFEYEIKDGLVKILSYTGSKKKLRIPSKIDNKNVYTICTHAFLGLDTLEEVIIPKSVGKIEDEAFRDCINLLEVHIPLIDDFQKNSFLDCHDNFRLITSSPNMADKIEKICENLGVVHDKDFQVEVTDEAKKECKLIGARVRLDSLYIPDEIDGYKIVSIDFELRDCDEKDVFIYRSLRRTDFRNHYKTIKFPKYLRVIPQEFFHGIYVDNIVFGSNLEEIGDYAFYFCKIDNLKLPEGVKIIGSNAFEECSVISLSIPDSVEEIGIRAFDSCNRLSKIRLSNNLKFLGTDAFSHCESLEEIILPDSLEKIEPQTFWRCVSLKNIVLPKNLKTIGKYAFFNCWHLEEITIPDSVTYIGERAFTDCNSMRKIHYNGSAKGACWSKVIK